MVTEISCAKGYCPGVSSCTPPGARPNAQLLAESVVVQILSSRGLHHHEGSDIIQQLSPVPSPSSSGSFQPEIGSWTVVWGPAILSGSRF